jgi:hypothetical protein
MHKLTLAALLSALLAAPGAHAQGSPVAAPPPCDYRTCTLSVVAGWDGPSILRGIPARRVATLNYFWPQDITALVSGSDRSIVGADSAASEARYAMHLRQTGTALTDGGLALIGLAALTALRARHVRGSDAIIAGAGLVAIGVSVPFHINADAALARAVQWHNVRFGR